MDNRNFICCRTKAEATVEGGEWVDSGCGGGKRVCPQHLQMRKELFSRGLEVITIAAKGICHFVPPSAATIEVIFSDSLGTAI